MPERKKGVFVPPVISCQQECARRQWQQRPADYLYPEIRSELPGAGSYLNGIQGVTMARGQRLLGWVKRTLSMKWTKVTTLAPEVTAKMLDLQEAQSRMRLD